MFFYLSRFTLLIISFVALSWFKDHFIKCNDRAALVKTWLPAQYDGPKSWLDQLVYDRALVLVRSAFLPSRSCSSSQLLHLQSRTAARKELLDQATSPDECEKLYEESLWCLYALQDDLLQTGNPFMDEDRETIATCKLCIIAFAVLLDGISFVLSRDKKNETSSCPVSR